MDALITIQQQDGRQVVSARELHAFLESKKQFADWIKHRIAKYDLTEGEDYTSVSLSGETGGKIIEYALTLDAAKELAMVEGNQKGKQARRYFIDCEKQLKQEPVQVVAPTAEILLQQSQLLLNQAQQLNNQDERLLQLELTVQQIMAGLHPPVKRPPSRPTYPPHELTTRKQITDLVNAYCVRKSVLHADVWNWLYDELYRQFSVRLKGYARKPGDSLLEMAERFGHLNKLYSIIMSELYYDEYHS